MRGITDYWVNDAIGRPFFVIEKQIDPGLLATLRNDIVPRLLKEVPYQPSEQQLNENPCLCRFVLVFDREGYSPHFFKKCGATIVLAARRIINIQAIHGRSNGLPIMK